MKILIDVRLYIILLALLVVQGCVAVQSFPLAARAGDTITIAAGSVDGMSKSNTTINFISDEPATLGNTYDLTSNIRVITKIYPDKTSQAWTTSNATGIQAASGHGPWQTVIVLDLDPTLPVGMGHFEINTAAYTGNSFVMTSVNNVSIAIEILPGVGATNNFSYEFFGNTLTDDLSKLEPRNQAIITNPQNSSVQSLYGAIEVIVNASILDASGNVVPDASILVVPDDQPEDSRVQKQLSWSRSGDEISIYVISPVGLLNEIQVRTSIVIPENATFSVLPTIASINYYDANGEVVTGPTPTVAIVP